MPNWSSFYLCSRSSLGVQKVVKNRKEGVRHQDRNETGQIVANCVKPWNTWAWVRTTPYLLLIMQERVKAHLKTPSICLQTCNCWSPNVWNRKRMVNTKHVSQNYFLDPIVIFIWFLNLVTQAASVVDSPRNCVYLALIYVEIRFNCKIWELRKYGRTNFYLAITGNSNPLLLTNRNYFTVNKLFFIPEGLGICQRPSENRITIPFHVSKKAESRFLV